MQIQTNSHIQLVEAEDIRPLRHKMLRQGQEFSTTSYKRDDEEDTFHLGVFVENFCILKLLLLSKKSFIIFLPSS